MNLAKHVSWETLLTLGGALLAGVSVGAHYSDWVIGCWAFTGAQYLIHNFISLQRVDRNLQILCLRTELKKSVDEAIKDLEALRKEAARRDD